MIVRAEVVCTFCDERFTPSGDERVCRRDVRLVALGYVSRAEYQACIPDVSMTWCATCRATWSRTSKMCHCPTCHQTFTTPGNCDRHVVRVCGRCTVDARCKAGRHLPNWVLAHLDPGSVGLVQRSDVFGAWASPAGDYRPGGSEAVIGTTVDRENGSGGDV